MPFCDECDTFVKRRMRLDVKRGDKELDYEYLVCSSCYSDCVKANGETKCQKYKKNTLLSEKQKQRRDQENKRKLAVAAHTKNTKLFPKVPNTKPS